VLEFTLDIDAVGVGLVVAQAGRHLAQDEDHDLDNLEKKRKIKVRSLFMIVKDFRTICNALAAKIIENRLLPYKPVVFPNLMVYLCFSLVFQELFLVRYGTAFVDYNNYALKIPYQYLQTGKKLT
jgi:hypothetical protein